MRVLSESSNASLVVAAVPVRKLEELLAAPGDAPKKIGALGELMKRAEEDARIETLQRINQAVQAHGNRMTSISLADERSLSHRSQPPPPPAGHRSRPRQRTPGIYIGAEDATSHPLLRSSALVKMILFVFGAFLITEPLFIGLSADAQTMSIAFFVLTLLLGSLTAYNFVETREQELRMFLGEPEDGSHVSESREPRLNYSFAAFVGALFVQLVYALVASRVVVRTSLVVLVTLLSCLLLFFSYGFLVSFENRYQIADR